MGFSLLLFYSLVRTLSGPYFQYSYYFDFSEMSVCRLAPSIDLRSQTVNLTTLSVAQIFKK